MPHMHDADLQSADADPLQCLFCINLCCASCRLWLRPFAFAPHRHTVRGSTPCNSDSASYA
eukprot:357392-Chlamydomonas_euryale.AAC.53